ncbi:MAG: penicillin-binding transpeptidase domain-containing protein, partial [Gammaproteobacteria bacterium]|nr:penicillin-binding transpeptidase domain-containing protein [Gammaproteobacteria bacterium]
ETAKQLKALMRATVKHGSARKSFRGFFKGAYAKLDVGGKTGSLTGLSPRGKNDWFVGFASDGSRNIAFAVLMVNVEKWKVKSAYVARKALENYFNPDRES